jgi:N-acetylmuramoyl-L-alanine amidase
MHKIWKPSPNFDVRPDGASIEFLIIHYTACDFDLSLKILTQGQSQNPVSAHYLIGEDGEVFQLVDESMRAWHAGQSAWREYKGINAYSIGIELVNLGNNPYSERQMVALINLALDIQERHAIRAEFVLGHSDIAPMRKVDPGILFDWQRLSNAGIGRYASHLPRPQQSVEISSVVRRALEHSSDYHRVLFHKLQTWGYVFSADNQEECEAVLSAFIAHYCPEFVRSASMPEALRILDRLSHPAL